MGDRYDQYPPPGGGGRPPFDSHRMQHDPMQSKILNSRNLEELTNLILLDQFEFNLVHCSTAFNKFGTFRKDRQKLSTREQGALRSLLDMAKDKQFLPRQASNIVRAVAVGALHEENPQALVLLSALLEQDSFEQWKPMELAYVVEALGMMKLKHDGFIGRLATELPARNLSTFNAQDITTILSGLAEMQVDVPEIFDAFARELLRRDLKQDLKDKARRGDMDATIFTLQRLVTILCALAQVRLRTDFQLLEKIGHEIATRQIKYMKSSEVANVAWAFTVLGHQPKGVFEKIIAEVESRRVKFSYHQLATIAWAFATTDMSATDKKLYEIVGKEIKFRNERDATIESIVNLAWSFARVQYHHNEMLVKLANDVSHNRDLGLFSPEQIAYLSFAFASLQFRHSHLYDVIASNLASRSNLNDFRPGDLAVIAWSLGVSGSKGVREGLSAIAREVFSSPSSRSLSEFTNQQLGQLIRGIAESDDDAGIKLNPTVYQSISDEIHSRTMSSLKTREIANIARGYARMGWNDSKLFELIAETVVVRSLEGVSVADLAAIVWSFASLGFHHRALFDHICNACVSGIADATATDLIALTWGLACNDHLSTSPARSLLEVTTTTMKEPPSHERTAENASMLTQTIAMWRLRTRAMATNNEDNDDQSSSSSGSALPALLEQLKSPNDWISTALASTAKNDPTSSFTPVASSSSTAQPSSRSLSSPSPKTVEKQVSKTLQEMGFVHVVEGYRHPVSHVRASIRLTSNVLVDVVDSVRDVLCDGKSLNGSCAMRHRLLENAGFYVAVVTTKEWTGIGQGEEDLQAMREAFLEDKLSRLGK